MREVGEQRDSMRVPARRCSTMPIDEASIAQAAKPASAKRRSAACSVTGSGVVRPVHRSAPTRAPADGGSPTAERADDAAALAEHAQRLRDPPGGRGLAVGAGARRSRRSRCARLVEEAAGDRAGRGLQARQRGDARVARSRTRRRRRPRPGRRPRRPRARAATNGAAVVRVARPGDEGVAGAARGGCRCAARATPRCSQPGRARRRPMSRRVQRPSEALLLGRHVVLAMICGLTSRSGGTPSMRSVCWTTWLNTGAATSPP